MLMKYIISSIRSFRKYGSEDLYSSQVRLLKIKTSYKKIESTINSSVDYEHLEVCRTMIWKFKANYPLEAKFHSLLSDCFKNKLKEIESVVV